MGEAAAAAGRRGVQRERDHAHAFTHRALVNPPLEYHFEQTGSWSDGAGGNTLPDFSRLLLSAVGGEAGSSFGARPF